MTSDIKEKRRKRLKNKHVHNAIAKDLRTPKYKMRVVPDKRKKYTENNLQKQVQEEIDC